MENWDFDCPQFIDFAAALNSPSNEVFYDVSSDVQSTATCESGCLGPKMCTPKVKPNDPLRNFPFVNFSTDDEKLATLGKLPARLSKSDGCINQIKKSLKTPEEKICKKKRRTSFSVDCLKKKRVNPITPNCLKRTLQNSKLKNVKTSEELELQKISELQNMLQKHLRLNKINLKRLKMNKAPFTLDKLPKKTEPKAPTIKSSSTTSSKPAATSNRIMHHQSNAVRSRAAFSRGLNNHFESLQSKEKCEAAKKKAPSNVLRDCNVQKKESDKSLKKLPLLEKYDAHGGLKFLPHQEKTTPRPFSFDTSYASSQNASQRATNLSKIHSLSVSRNMPYILDNKENLVK